MTGRGRIVAGALALAAGLAACNAQTPATEDAAEAEREVLYGVGDDQSLWRWEVGTDTPEQVLDLSGAWERGGDVGAVLISTLTIDPTERRAAWIAGGNDESELVIGDLESGETEVVDSYPLDHACLDPAWLPDGSALLIHRADVWGDTGTPDEKFAETEWYSPEGANPPAVELDPGCRLRWYTDGAVEGLYRDLAVTELYRVDQEGSKLETIAIDSLGGVDNAVTDLVEVDPSGQYACLADGYTETDDFEGGFTIRPQAGTNVIDLESGESVGGNCESLLESGYLSRTDTDVKFIDYQGVVQWEETLPTEINNAPDLFYFHS